MDNEKEEIGNELFQMVLTFTETGDDIDIVMTCCKDGQEAPVAVLDENETYIAYRGATYAASILLVSYVKASHRNGHIEDDVYEKIMKLHGDNNGDTE